MTAVAKEKEAAKMEHSQAIQQGRMTGLVEHVTDDGMITGFHEVDFTDWVHSFHDIIEMLATIADDHDEAHSSHASLHALCIYPNKPYLVCHGPDGRRVYGPRAVPAACFCRQPVRCGACRYDRSEEHTTAAHQDIGGRSHEGDNTKYHQPIAPNSFTFFRQFSSANTGYLS